MPLGSWYSQLPPFGWFDREDKPGSAAYQVNGRSIPDSQQGIALPSRGGLGKWYNVTPPGADRPMPFQQTDLGPAKWTGRGVDISAAAAHQMGYTPKNFPTDSNFKVEPIDLTGLGLAAGYGGGIPGDNTAYAPGPDARRKMPDEPRSLLDMFQPRSPAGEPSSFADALASRSNSLVGLGLGLMSAPPGQALRGYQAGADLDARTAQQALAMRERQAERKQAQSNFERTFAQSALTPYQKMQADIERAKGTPNEQQVMDFYRSQLDAGPPQTREVFDQTLGRNVVQEWDSRSKQYKTSTMGGGGTAAPGTATAPGPGGAAAPAPQPVLPPKKPLSAHEQTAIDDADKAVIANRGVIGTLQDAKRLSKNAFSGLFPTERAQVGAQIPDYLPGMSSNQTAKNTLLLNNAVISQAVEQLKATFGGNPSEGERKILLEMAGSVNSPDSVRQDIYDRAIKAANARLELNQRRAQEIRGGTYYNPGGERSSATPQASGPTPSADAVRALKNNPQRRDEFDAKYGAGAAMRVLRGE